MIYLMTFIKSPGHRLQIRHARGSFFARLRGHHHHRCGAHPGNFSGSALLWQGHRGAGTGAPFNKNLGRSLQKHGMPFRCLLVQTSWFPMVVVFFSLNTGFPLAENWCVDFQLWIYFNRKKTWGFQQQKPCVEGGIHGIHVPKFETNLKCHVSVCNFWKHVGFYL